MTLQMTPHETTAENTTADKTMADAPFMFRLVHATFRADVAGIADDAARLNAGEAELLEPLRERVATLAIALHEHHTSEDELVFPVLLQRRPDRCSALLALESEHTVLDAALEAVRVALDLADPRAAADAALRLVKVLNEHLDHEETVAVPISLAVFSDDEMAALEATMQQRTGPLLPVLLPWIQTRAPKDLLAQFPA